MPGQKNLCAFLALAMTATLFAGCSGNSDSSDSTSSVATKDSTSSDKTLKVACRHFILSRLLMIWATTRTTVLMLSLHIFLFIQTLFQLMTRAMQMVIIYAVAEAVIPVVSRIGTEQENFKCSPDWSEQIANRL